MAKRLSPTSDGGMGTKNVKAPKPKQGPAQTPNAGSPKYGTAKPAPIRPSRVNEPSE